MTGANGSPQREAILRRAVVELQDARARAAELEAAAKEPIAVVGMACRLPGGVRGPEELWELLCSGGEGISEVPSDRWDVDAYYDADPDAPGKTYSRHAGFIDDATGFDARFFDIPPREAGWMDPQHRLVLELGWTALEHAGIAPDALRGSRTGVFMGMTAGDYAQIAVKQCDAEQIDAYIGTGNAANFAAGRLSYFLGLVGPSLALDTACSSSLVSVHLACQSLRSGESELALAGGVNLLLSPETTVALAKARMLSPGGRCRTFDAAADGYVRGEGCGIVVLKRLSDATAAGDHIWAVIRGSAVNQDGRSSGLTVPYAAAQEQVIGRALEVAGVGAGSVGYVEAHGTGTPLGDPIELRALGRVLGVGRGGGRALWVGSVKTNIGHLEAAAGVAGLIKAVLVVNRGLIPAHLHFREPNPHVAWEQSGLRVPTALTEFPSGPRIAGVSSFGISGTNAHIVVEGPPEPAPAAAPIAEVGGGVVVVKVSGRGGGVVGVVAGGLAGFVGSRGDVSVGGLAFGLGVGRAELADRGVVVAGDRSELVAGLGLLAGGGCSRDVLRGRVGGGGRPRVAFLVAGQGVGGGGCARELVACEPVAARVIDELCEVFGPRDALPLAALLEPGRDAELALGHTEVAQPAVFALALALGAWWRSVGVVADVVVGHSVGAYAAAVLAGALDVREGARLVAARGRLMAGLAAGGAMAAVFAGVESVAGYLGAYRDELAVGAFNAPSQTVLSGSAAVLDVVLGDLRARGIASQRLEVSHAFHSPLVEPVLEALGAEVAAAGFGVAQRTLISDSDGSVLDDDRVCDPGYWTAHARRPVDFVAALRALEAQRCRTLIELGPASTLLALAHRTLDPKGHSALPSLHPKTPASRQLRRSLGHAWTQGTPIDWHSVNPRPATPTGPLPTYPFQHQHHTLPEGRRRAAGARPSPTGPPLVPRPIPTPIAQRLFEAELRADRLPLVAEHRIHGHLVVPGVVYLELLLAAAAQAGIPEPAIADLVLPAPLVLADVRTVQITMQPSEDDRTTAQIHSYDPTADPQAAWTLHAHATVRAGGADVPPPAHDLAAVRARCGPEMSGADFYRLVWHPQFELGPSFRLVEHVARGEHEALAALTVPDAGGEVRPEVLLLDACVQVLMAALPDPEPPGQRSLSVGTGHRGFVSYREQMPSRVWCRAVVVEGERGEIRGDLELFDDDGGPLARVSGIGFAPLARETLDRLTSGGASSNGASAHVALVDVEALIAAEPGDRARMIAEHLRTEMGAVLGLPASEIDLDEPLVSLADSLMLAELKTRVEAAFAIAVAIEVLFEQPSLGELARWLASQLGGPASAEDDVGDELLAQIMSELEGLSDEDALALADEASHDVPMRRRADG